MSDIIEQKKTEAKVMKLFSFKQNHQKRSDEIFVSSSDQSNFKYQQLELNRKEKYLNLAKTETKSDELMQKHHTCTASAQKHHFEFHPICKSNFLFILIGIMLGACSLFIVQFLFQNTSSGSACSFLSPEIVRNIPIDCET